MPSTYSNLKLQMMATGENTATWGNTTNTNLGTALEEAVVGSADVTFASGNVTLTLTDVNTSQTARHLRLNLTGTTGGARDLIVPAIEKIYVVNNGCADAVTVKNSTGTGIAVPAGKTMWVYNNGTNVLDVVTHLTSLTLASALPVASGGTGVTTSTGTGAVVLNSSPALTTPNLGVPSFATLTNATGLPISTGVSGLGTNVATFLATPSSANLAAAVTDETGSGALVFATSPALTTPNLGVPSFATLTNATGLPISTGVSGLGANVATFLATPSSLNLLNAVTDETGTGALVFATSPALTTPNLGTPSFAVLTNASGLNLANTSVTTAQALPVSRGGTGQTSYTNGQLLIGNTTGNTLDKATLTAGSGITITNGAGSITISSSGSGGTVTSVNLSTGSTGLLVNGATSNVITSSGTWALTGTLAVANGGTGVTTSTGTGAVVLNSSPTLVTPALGTPASGVLTNCTGLPISTGVSGLGTNVATFLATPSSLNLLNAVSDETGTGALVFATSPTLVTPVLGTPTSANLANATALNVGNAATGTLAVARGGTGVTTSTGTGAVVLNSSPTLVTPALGTPASGVLTNCTGLPISTGVSGLGTNVATFLATPSSLNLLNAVSDETGTGALVFATSPTLVTPVLGTPTSANLANATALNVGNAATGTLAVARGGTGVTTSTGTGSVVLNSSPALTTPNLGTPSFADLTNVSGLNLANTSVTTATALPVSRGGTGGTTAADAQLNILPTVTSKPGGVLQVNAAGDAWEIAMQAKVSFTVSGTTVTTTASNNASVSRTGTGDYTVSITNAMPNAFYVVNAMGARNDTGDSLIASLSRVTTRTASACYITFTTQGGTPHDPEDACIWIQAV